MFDTIEAVQRRFTKKLDGMSSLSYHCALLNLERLELRRLRCALVTCCNIVYGLRCLTNENFSLYIR